MEAQRNMRLLCLGPEAAAMTTHAAFVELEGRRVDKEMNGASLKTLLKGCKLERLVISFNAPPRNRRIKTFMHLSPVN